MSNTFWLEKKIIFLTIFFAICIRAYPLAETSDSIAESFSSFIDNNEGTTIFRSLNIPTGGRSESLGTAFTGIADDINFFDYNPAGSSILKNSEIAFFHNSWISDSSMETLAATTRFNNLGIGGQLKCFYVPFTEYNLFGERVAGNYYSETSLTFNMSYNFLAGYNFKGISVGYNIRGSWRNVPDYTDNKTDNIKNGSGLSQSALGLMADIGVITRLNMAKYFNDIDPNFSIGATINNIGLAITGFGSSFALDDALPTKFNIGMSYRFIKPLLLSAEFRQPINLKKITTSEKFSIATGLEISFTNFFLFEAGFLLQGANPRISMGSQFNIKGIEMNINYTFDLTTTMAPINHISLSAKLNLGDKGRKAKQSLIQSKYAEGIYLYSQGTRQSISTAIIHWQEAKELSESIGIKYDPAIKAIKIAQDLLNVHDIIKDYGTLNKNN